MVIKYKKIQFINSTDRIQGTDSDFSIRIDLPKDKTFDRVVVLNSSFPKSYYLIPKGSFFTLKELAVYTNINVPEGNYNRKSFQTVITNLLNSNSPNNWTYSITYPDAFTGADIGKFIYTVSGNGSNQPSLIFNTRLYRQFGFNPNSVNDFVGNTITSANVLKFQSEDVLLINSDICDNGGDTILHEIYSSGSPNLSNIIHECQDPEQNSRVLTTSNSSVYRFFITDENGQLIDFNGLNITMTLMFYKKDTINNLIESYIKYKLLQNK
jgi:hypothetical protein